ncbi:hypothetical protein HK097_004234 [Rhizophlyctis rosea]|uniref:Uncharacterized protein n=1 Tax=Rhizophlyctis rosea TaxID=64517 RepID=A0AAD5SHA3_9FUNG|nr:hypothetical protein HK097_004234 [Rhizophlyctis rosea]
MPELFRGSLWRGSGRFDESGEEVNSIDHKRRLLQRLVTMGVDMDAESDWMRRTAWDYAAYEPVNGDRATASEAAEWEALFLEFGKETPRRLTWDDVESSDEDKKEEED